MEYRPAQLKYDYLNFKIYNFPDLVMHSSAEFAVNQSYNTQSMVQHIVYPWVAIAIHRSGPWRNESETVWWQDKVTYEFNQLYLFISESITPRMYYRSQISSRDSYTGEMIAKPGSSIRRTQQARLSPRHNILPQKPTGLLPVYLNCDEIWHYSYKFAQDQFD